jgi:periplasmic divalent cation tolerance protein
MRVMASPDPVATRIVLMTAPDLAVGKRLARTLVERKLAACVNLVPLATSIYAWQGQIEESSEVLLVAKTAADRVAALEAAVAELHPYDVPEVVVLDAIHVEAKYRAWLLDATR